MPSSRARRAAARAAAASRRRRAIGGIIIAAVVAGGIGVGARVTGSESGHGGRPSPLSVRAGSKILPGRTGLVRITDEPASYRLVYRVETFNAGDRITTRDELEIRRPFDGRTTKRTGSQADSPVRSAQVARLGHLYVPPSSGSAAALLETGPAQSPSDVRIAPVLEDLLAARRVEAREWRSVGGRPCQTLRFGGPVSSGTVAPVLAPAREYADACVSETGLVLEEVWVVRGRVQRRRLAIDVVEGPALSDSDFAAGTGAPLPVAKGGGSFRPVDPSTAYAAPFWVLEPGPLPTYRGRWAVVDPAGGDPDSEETKERRRGYVVDVWQDGINTLTLEQGSTSGGVPPFDLGDGPRVSVDGLGEGEVVLDLRGSEVRFVRDGGYFVRVRGTASRSRLEELVRQLRRTEGGSGIVYLDRK
ncbi:MAG TPA: hypothetical protein VM143_07355 [Acidimicrobiales bacterium]|nr:hypothetical protein [Acidimicrobiales bacterium]